jgi:hypothetical protein
VEPFYFTPFGKNLVLCYGVTAIAWAVHRYVVRGWQDATAPAVAEVLRDPV